MAKVFTGRDGRMEVDGVTIAKVVNFQLSANVDMLETTTLDENLRTYTPGITGYTGSASLLYYKDSSNQFNTKLLLQKIFKSNNLGVTAANTVKLTFKWLDGPDTRKIQLNAYVNSANIGAATGEIVRAEIQFTGTDQLLDVAIQ
tara:strand:- start:37 stop:471 length:435 start_codon:yes stop_codon:yes gene_type:complete